MHAKIQAHWWVTNIQKIIERHTLFTNMNFHSFQVANWELTKHGHLFRRDYRNYYKCNRHIDRLNHYTVCKNSHLDKIQLLYRDFLFENSSSWIFGSLKMDKLDWPTFLFRAARIFTKKLIFVNFTKKFILWLGPLLWKLNILSNKFWNENRGQFFHLRIFTEIIMMVSCNVTISFIRILIICEKNDYLGTSAYSQLKSQLIGQF